MPAQRQLALESYVGFTLFKNGLAAAYGGAWLLGPRAAFGMNIFEPYRGGESGFMMCQVLRTYRQLFGASCFEVDAHQFGLDNPDGITTAAFSFYYRLGFRPLDPTLRAVAELQRQKMRRQPSYPQQRAPAALHRQRHGAELRRRSGRPAPRPAGAGDAHGPAPLGGDRRAAERVPGPFRTRTGPSGQPARQARPFALELALVAAGNGVGGPARAGPPAPQSGVPGRRCFPAVGADRSTSRLAAARPLSLPRRPHRRRSDENRATVHTRTRWLLCRLEPSMVRAGRAVPRARRCAGFQARLPWPECTNAWSACSACASPAGAPIPPKATASSSKASRPARALKRPGCARTRPRRHHLRRLPDARPAAGLRHVAVEAPRHGAGECSGCQRCPAPGPPAG